MYVFHMQSVTFSILPLSERIERGFKAKGRVFLTSGSR